MTVTEGLEVSYVKHSGQIHSHLHPVHGVDSVQCCSSFAEETAALRSWSDVLTSDAFER